MLGDTLIELKNVSKGFGGDGKLAVNNISFSVKEGEFVTFLGPSGCGKTTTLRMIAGFEQPTAGQILLNGKDISQIPPYKRPVNTVFQRYALFPHLNVYENIAFGLKLKRVDTETPAKGGGTVIKKLPLSKKEIEEKVHAALKMVDLSDYEKRNVESLSGGQQQRVAIARALVNEPKVLLLDEPLGALDLKMRQDMQLELRAMHKKAGITFVYVTHDQEEALTMSDKIVVMRDGVIQQEGTPAEIYNEPVNAFVADFIGESNIIGGVIAEDGKVRFAGETFPCETKGFKKGQSVDVVIRPEDIFVFPADKPGQIGGKVITNIFKGVYYEMTIEAGGIEFLVQDTAYSPVGRAVNLFFKTDDIHIMRKEHTVNRFAGTLTADYKVNFAGADWDCDVLTLFHEAKFNEDETLVGADGAPVETDGVTVSVEVDLNAVELTDDIDAGAVAAHITGRIFKGNHWQVLARTEDGEDFYVNTKDNYDDRDMVGLKIKKQDIKLAAAEPERADAEGG